MGNLAQNLYNLLENNNILNSYFANLRGNIAAYRGRFI